MAELKPKASIQCGDDGTVIREIPPGHPLHPWPGDPTGVYEVYWVPAEGGRILRLAGRSGRYTQIQRRWRLWLSGQEPHPVHAALGNTGPALACSRKDLLRVIREAHSHAMAGVNVGPERGN